MTDFLEYPLVPIRNTVMFPETVAPLYVSRVTTVAAVDRAFSEGSEVFLVAQRDPDLDDDITEEDLYQVGTIGKILQLLRLPDGKVKILIEGLGRAALKACTKEDFLMAHVVPVADIKPASGSEQGLVRALWRQFNEYLKLNDQFPPEVTTVLKAIDEPGMLADAMMSHLSLGTEYKQSVLEMLDVKARVEYVVEHMERELEWLNIEQRIHDNVKMSIAEDQRNYFKRQKLEAIQKELSQEDPQLDELQRLEERLKALNLPEDIHSKVMTELEKLSMMPPMSPEATVVRTYLDWFTDLPWHEKTKLNDDLENAEVMLNADHYGLKSVKDRILESLAVQIRVSQLKGSILCLVGPPGVGKTSLGRSIAAAMGREFERIALGGVRDESEIRGHRRTYVGAMPGRVIKAMKRAKVVNPLIMLDEVDKLGKDFRGDPASALLEVLDPEQNHTFNDHYLDVNYDLSNVMFIATANTLDIPPALLDRMEVIRIPGYTHTEKVRIARDHLLPKAMKDCGLEPSELSVSQGALEDVATYYCREAGVRHLQRELGKICRKIVKDKVGKQSKGKDTAAKVRVTRSSLTDLLGVRRYDKTRTLDQSRIGVVNGLAWTAMGGDLLHVEAMMLPGKGKLIHTGSLGDVMRESIQTAWSLVRQKASTLGVEADFFQKADVHIHLPEGATPKDGPSAGITLCTAMLSMITQIPVNRMVAMTGEITLRGEVLAIGGLKEKLLAAQSAGIEKVLIPKANEKDLNDIPDYLKKGLEIQPVRWLDEVFEAALLSPLLPECIHVPTLLMTSSPAIHAEAGEA